MTGTLMECVTRSAESPDGDWTGKCVSGACVHRSGLQGQTDTGKDTQAKVPATRKRTQAARARGSVLSRQHQQHAACQTVTRTRLRQVPSEPRQRHRVGRSSRMKRISAGGGVGGSSLQDGGGGGSHLLSELFSTLHVAKGQPPAPDTWVGLTKPCVTSEQLGHTL